MMLSGVCSLILLLKLCTIKFNMYCFETTLIFKEMSIFLFYNKERKWIWPYNILSWNELCERFKNIYSKKYLSRYIIVNNSIYKLHNDHISNCIYQLYCNLWNVWDPGLLTEIITLLNPNTTNHISCLFSIQFHFWSKMKAKWKERCLKE